MMSSVLNEQRNAEARTNITARLRGVSSRSKPALTKPVVPKFVEQPQGLTACFVARAEALSCQFLAAEKTEGKTEGKDQSKDQSKTGEEKSLGKTLKTFFETRRDEKSAKKVSKKTALPLLLFDASEQAFWERLGMLKSLEDCCRLKVLDAGVKGTDFIDEPFPAFSLQHATCAIAETGTLVFANRTRAQAVVTFLPTTHIVLLAERDIVGSLEEAFARVPSSPKSGEKAGLWACHCVSGPSRTADIEQTLHMGAHGPKEIFILLYS